MTAWRSRFGGREWRLTPDGIQSRSPGGADLELHRTAGAPRTMRLYLALWYEELVAAATAAGVPVALLLQTVATENGAAHVDGNHLDVLPPRREPGYTSDDATPHRISVGPCHILISSARTVMADPTINRAWLQVPAQNIMAAARFIAGQRGRTGLDPILVAAAYNAGGLYDATTGKWANRWHLKTFGNHLDRAASWYGDAARVIQEDRNLWSLDMGGLGRVAA